MFWMIFQFFKKIGFLGILGPSYCGIGATIRIGREMLCLPYAGFLNYDFQHDHIRDGAELPDVTLVCKEECQFQAHRVILDKNKTVLFITFLTCKHPHPLISLTGPDFLKIL